MFKLILKILVLLFISAVYFYGFTPVIAWGFHGIPFFILIILTVLYGFHHIQKPTDIYRKKSLFIPTLFWLYISIYFLFILFSTLPVFQSEKYQQLIGEVRDGNDLSDQIAPISLNEVAIVDIQTAYRLGDKVIGGIPSLGSQAHVGNFTLQKVNNKLYWVAPLLHSGLFKWLDNKAGSQGFIKVSATNDRDVTLVKEVDNEPIYIKYQPNAYFGDNLSRHIYFNGYKTQGITDFTFELNDKGHTYWVVTLYNHEIGFSGSNATGVITIDPTTGEIKKYTIKNAPEWIDRIQPANFAINQLNDWGEYVEGFWNPSNHNKLTTTEGVTIVFGTNNEAYWYTGLTSVGADEGTVGFVLVNTRTKATSWYRGTGATEKAARYSAMGKVQEKGYVASFPVTYNINGKATYIMSLKDKAGLIKMIAMVSVEDFSIVGVGNNLKEAYRNYKSVLNDQFGLKMSSENRNDITKGIIMRLQQYISNGNSFFTLTTTDDSIIFIGSSQLSAELILSNPGDSIELSFDASGEITKDLTFFKNITLNKELANNKAQKD